LENRCSGVQDVPAGHRNEIKLYLFEPFWLIPTMARGQLWLFPPPTPLVDRLGDAFFRAVPASPGVYLMCGPREGVLYVGKAKNLRKRLASYRVSNPERFPRRIVRLLNLVTRIEWDECATETAAQYREELLICVLAPRFNVSGKVFERRAPFKYQGIPPWQARRAV
jgi:predicted GIY-YIG superfamily endonuclease